MSRNKNKHKQSSPTVQQETNEPSYPSAELLLDVCSEDYQRVQENYNKIYEKINIALAFSGVALTLMLSAFDISTAGLFVSGLKVWQLVLTIIEIVCSIGSIIMVLIATVWFLILLHGRTVKVFKSEDIIDKDIHKEKSEFAAVWVMDKYTNAVGEMRKIIHKKQKSFDKAIVIIIVGIVMYAVSILLQKGGF